MTRVVRGLKSMLIAVMVLGLGLSGVAGCGSSGSSSTSSAASTSTSSGTIDRPSSTASSPQQSTAPSAATSTSGAVTLSWDAPTENADGSVLADLKGYKVHYGSASKTYSDTIEVANAGLTTYVVQNLPAGIYYFAVTAYNSEGSESSLSGEISAQVVD